jgi:hypothetical protein
MRILTNNFDGPWLLPRATRALAATLAILIAGYAPLCLAQSSETSHSSSTASHSAPPTYESPEDAATALLHAVESGDVQSLRKLLGAGSELVSSGDTTGDKLDRERFVQKYQEMHRLAPQSDGSTILFVGVENWPFPVPLVGSHGHWRFDPKAGATEVLLRRIGEDEMTAIDVCHSLVEAQKTPATDNAPSVPPEAAGVITALLAKTGSENKPIEFQGYYFRVISRTPDRFAAVAYPITYRSSGVMTFLVNQSDIVYQRDLGRASARTAGKLTATQPDSKWVPAEKTEAP